MMEETVKCWLRSLKKHYRDAVRTRDFLWAIRYEVQIILLTRLLNKHQQPKGEHMKLNQFASIVTKEEGLKKSISVAQVKEVLRIANQHTSGKIYKAIKEEAI